MNKFNLYIYLILIIKFIFMFLALSIFYLKYTGKEETEKFKKFKFWKERVEFVFIFLMSALLIYIFNPRIDRTKHLNYETRLLFYLFGFVIIITLDWENFLKENIFTKNKDEK